jgi:hypothetical protein
MSAKLRFLAAMTLVLAAMGCRSGATLSRPGTLQYQQYNATLHDPYADNDAGPEIEGGRPRDFEKPLAEPVRSRWLRDSWWSR